ncbi:MAG: glycolate oxidase subunit GlcF [Roseibacillus sp.]|nr:glycolate oxidase subunit GlcF [Roseibacillus sp.]
MLHKIDAEKVGPFGEPMAEAVRSCVHCGFCLAACPTYGELGQELDTPRGRIVLMKEVLEGGLEVEEALPHLDACLGCLACEPACPSGVEYRNLISPFRTLAEEKRSRPASEKLRRFMVLQSLPYPGRFRVAATMGKFAKPFANLLPKSMRAMMDLLPSSLPPKQELQERYEAKGERRAVVALLAGCAQQVLDPDINAATIEVLTRQGVEVLVPKAQGCCGALSWHVGDHRAAQAFARKNLDAFSEVDAIITNAAGCGSGMHEYPLILRGTDDEGRATEFAKKVVDVTVFLRGLGDLEEIPDSKKEVTIAYHDACHLSNGQGVRDEPRELLRRIPGVTVVELREAHLCCGSAGTYNVDQPGIAASLGAQKAQAVVATGATVVASGNIGCLTQLKMHLERLDSGVQVRHTVQVLRDAWDSR